MTVATNPLGEGPVGNIDDVLTRLAAIQTFTQTTQPLGEHDGVASFNFLYHLITEEVRDGADKGRFTDAPFIRELDVAFANRYLDALRADFQHPGTAPKVWQALIDDRSNRHIGPMRFAIAGVNAHINFDLAFALLNACQKLGQPLDAGEHHATYQKINDIFDEQMQPLRQHFENAVEKAIEKLFGRWLNRGSDLAVVVSREAAWTNAAWMWPHVGDRGFLDPYEAGMDDAATALSDMILMHV
jgi:hypothetical protein